MGALGALAGPQLVLWIVVLGALAGMALALVRRAAIGAGMIPFGAAAAGPALRADRLGPAGRMSRGPAKVSA